MGMKAHKTVSWYRGAKQLRAAHPPDNTERNIAAKKGEYEYLDAIESASHAKDRVAELRAKGLLK